MQQLAARYTALMDAAIDAIVLIDRKGLIVDANPATLRLFGYAKTDLIGHNVSCLMPEPYRAEHDGYLGRYMNEGQPRIIGIGREVLAQRCDGSVFPIDLAVGEIRSEHASGFVGFIRDLTTRKAIEAKLAAREKELVQQRERIAEVGQLGMLAELASGISHEINQPLAAISTYAQACRRLAADPVANADVIVQTLEKINQQAERAGKVVHSMRRLVRHQGVESHTLAINGLLAEVESLLALDPHKLKITCDLDASDPCVQGDETQLQQVLVNLVRNAYEASVAAPYTVQVELRSRVLSRDWVEVAVLDRGDGVPEHLVGQVFSPFVTGRKDGLGLGLSISKSIVDAHGGDLSCRAREGGGTCFTMLLPRAGEGA